MSTDDEEEELDESYEEEELELSNDEYDDDADEFDDESLEPLHPSELPEPPPPLDSVASNHGVPRRQPANAKRNRMTLAIAPRIPRIAAKK